MINAQCQDLIPRNFPNRRAIFFCAGVLLTLPLQVNVAQQILYLRLEYFLGLRRARCLGHILENHGTNRKPGSWENRKNIYFTIPNYGEIRVFILYPNFTQIKCLQEIWEWPNRIIVIPSRHTLTHACFFNFKSLCTLKL